MSTEDEAPEHAWAYNIRADNMVTASAQLVQAYRRLNPGVGTTIEFTDGSRLVIRAPGKRKG